MCLRLSVLVSLCKESPMNSFERKALKRANESKAKWKQKAIERNKRLRAAQLRIRDLVKSRQIWRDRALAAQEQSHQEIASSPL